MAPERRGSTRLEAWRPSYGRARTPLPQGFPFQVGRRRSGYGRTRDRTGSARVIAGSANSTGRKGTAGRSSTQVQMSTFDWRAHKADEIDIRPAQRCHLHRRLCEMGYHPAATAPRSRTGPPGSTKVNNGPLGSPPGRSNELDIRGFDSRGVNGHRKLHRSWSEPLKVDTDGAMD